MSDYTQVSDSAVGRDERLWAAGAHAGALVAAIAELVGAPLAIGEDELAQVRLDHVHSAQKAEAL